MKWNPRRAGLQLTLLASLAAARAFGETVPLSNPSFEILTGNNAAHFDAQGKLRPGHYSNYSDPATSLGFQSNTAIPGWDGFGTAGIAAPVLGPGPANLFATLPDGRQVMFAEDDASVVQVLPTTYRAGTRYTLTLGIGRPAGLAATGRWEVSLGSPLKSLVVENGALQVPVGEFRPATLSYSVLAGDPVIGQPILISLIGIATPATYFDNLHLEAVPVEAPTAAIATAVEVSWPSKVNETYRVERATRLTNPDWTPVTANLKGTGGRMQLFEVAADQARYYRVLPVLAP